MAAYRTMQKRALIDFMTEHSETAFSAEELSEKMKNESLEIIPGKSTVYRLLQKLVEEGMVKRMVSGNSRKFVYQIVSGKHCDSHLHLKCTSCGKLLHMDDGESNKLLMQVLEKNRFTIDERQTVLLGRCIGCVDGKAEKNEK